MAIEVACPQCQTILEAPDELAGKKGKCPKCTSVLDIPQAEPSGEAAPAAEPPKGEKEGGEAKPKKLLSKCSECGQQFAFSEAKKGATINCPKCKKQMTLPT